MHRQHGKKKDDPDPFPSHPLAGDVPAPRRQEPPAETPASPLRILVIEDDRLSRVLLTEWLIQDGHRVLLPEPDQDPVTLVRSQEVDRILTDLHLPDRDGVELIRTIRALPDPRKAGVPILVVTAETRPEPLRAARSAGADVVLCKPVERSMLRQALTPHPPLPVRHLRSEPQTSDTILNTGILEQGCRSLGTERFLSICQIFCALEHETVQAMEQACQRSEAQTLAEIAHRLSGRAGHLGMESLAAQARTLVNEARQMLPSECAERVRTLAAASQAAGQALKQWMRQRV
ncbi:MAG: response regulator [Magnetococcales bacterium]|nr:response regulator [Magnetococcales bacterium]